MGNKLFLMNYSQILKKRNKIITKDKSKNKGNLTSMAKGWGWLGMEKEELVD